METMLEYHKAILSDLAHHDSLIVMARGLGLDTVLLHLLRPLCSAPQTVFVTNLTHEDEESLTDALAASGASPLPRTISSDLSAPERAALYTAGGVLLCGARILLMDLLQHRIAPQNIGGLLVPHADRITPGGPEAFAVRLLRQAAPRSFVKALSESPERLRGALGKTMDALGLRHVQLVPRFHASVVAALEAHAPEVLELAVPLSARMVKLQHAIVQMMQALVAELRGANRSLDLGSVGRDGALGLDVLLFRGLEQSIRSQLEPIWHSVTPRSKALLGELATLRKMLDVLMREDCVSFYRYLEALRADKMHWMFAPEADALYATARERLFRTVAPRSGEAAQGPQIKVVLDENPKWAVLREVLAEIAQEIEKHQSSPETEGASAEERGGKRRRTEPASSIIGSLAAQSAAATMIAVHDEKAQWALEDVLAATSPRAFLESQFHRWLRQRQRQRARSGNAEPDDLPHLPAPPKRKAFGMAKRKMLPSLSGNTNNNNHISNTSNNQNGDVPSVSFGGATDKALEELLGKLETQANKQREAAVAKVNAAMQAELTRVEKKARYKDQNLSHEEEDGNDDSGALASVEERRRRVEAKYAPLFADALKSSAADDRTLSSASAREFLASFARIAPTAVCVVPSSGIGHPSHGLSAVQPHFVCVLDPDVATVRQLEVFKALHPGFPLRVYFFVYAESVEEERYRATLRREQDAFYALIQEKASLVFPQLPSTLSSASSSSSSLMMSGAPLPLSMRNADTFSSSASTNTTTTGKEQRIIIDLREFRSQLPALLHAEPQTTIVPVTLLVGDYILSPELCVERKALSDLVQSLGSGRLHAQAEAMERSYKTPLLLIEFDASRPFGLSSAADLADRDLSCTHTLAKVAILTMHHPRLRLLWARTPHSSVRLLLALKTHHEQPNAQDAIAKGDDDLLPAATCRSVGDLTADAAAADSSTTGGPVTTAIDVLRKLPGVTPHNVRTLVQRWDALADLCAARRDELCEALGAQNGGKLWDFLHKGE